MEQIQNRKTTTKHDEDGNTTHSASTITVRELDDGELGNLLANSSLLEPDLNAHTLNGPIIHFDISDNESMDAEETNNNNSQVHDILDDNWFPSLSKASWIQDLDKNDSIDDDDTLMTDRSMETLFASEILEIGDGDDNSASTAAVHGQSKTSRRTNHGPPTLDPPDKACMEYDTVISDSYRSLEKSSGLVPLNVVYTVLND